MSSIAATCLFYLMSVAKVDVALVSSGHTRRTIGARHRLAVAAPGRGDPLTAFVAHTDVDADEQSEDRPCSRRMRELVVPVHVVFGSWLTDGVSPFSIVFEPFLGHAPRPTQPDRHGAAERAL